MLASIVQPLCNHAPDLVFLVVARLWESLSDQSVTPTHSQATVVCRATQSDESHVSDQDCTSQAGRMGADKDKGKGKVSEKDVAMADVD